MNLNSELDGSMEFNLIRGDNVGFEKINVITVCDSRRHKTRFLTIRLMQWSLATLSVPQAHVYKF